MSCYGHHRLSLSAQQPELNSGCQAEDLLRGKNNKNVEINRELNKIVIVGRAGCKGT